MLMHVQCLRSSTSQIAQGMRGPGLFTYVLDPLHFSQLAADTFGDLMDTLVDEIRWAGPDRTGLTEFDIRRVHGMPSARPVACIHEPGWIGMIIHADHASEVGCLALRRVVLARLPGWEFEATA